jgi:two-component system, OmpR family, response regulator
VTVRTVLLVDDEPDIRRIGELTLTRVGGFTVHLAPSGADAVEAALKHAPDIILLDVMMPGMDGAATLAALRADARTKAIPVIFMTAKVQRHEVERYRALGAVGVVAKPFDPMTLSNRIRAIAAGEGEP